jgi:hypothetical protein
MFRPPAMMCRCFGRSPGCADVEERRPRLSTNKPCSSELRHVSSSIRCVILVEFRDLGVYNMAFATFGSLEHDVRNISKFGKWRSTFWSIGLGVRNLLEFSTGRSQHVGV